MSSARSFMILASVFLLFIGACTYAADAVRSIEEGAQLGYALNREQDRKIIQTVPDAEGEETYTGAQIVYMLRAIEDIGADIEVNGVPYSKTGGYQQLNPALFKPNASYRAAYRRDAAGHLTKIIFRS